MNTITDSIKKIFLQIVRVDTWSIELMSSIAGMALALSMWGNITQFPINWFSLNNIWAMSIFILASVQFSSLMVLCNYYCKTRAVMALIAGGFWLWLGLKFAANGLIVVVLLLGVFNLVGFISQLLGQGKCCTLHTKTEQ